MKNQDYTQEECRVRWEALKKRFLEDLEKIDMDTPAVPSSEPSWWVEMVEVRRFILNKQ